MAEPSEKGCGRRWVTPGGKICQCTRVLLHPGRCYDAFTGKYRPLTG